MLFQGQVTQNIPTTRATGQPNAMQVQLGELGISEVLPRYAATTWSSQGFSVSVTAAAAITAYTGGAAGQPQIAVWNPAGTGKNLWPIICNTGVVVSASAAGVVSWGLWYGPTAAITAAASGSFPVNQLTLAASGSVAKAFINTALTSSTALTNVIPVGSYNWQSVAGTALVSNSQLTEFAGAVAIPPGSMMALGGSSALTSATWVGYLSWIEVPV